MGSIETRKKKILDKRWQSLEARGYTRPRSAEENRQRAHDAHHKTEEKK